MTAAIMTPQGSPVGSIPVRSAARTVNGSARVVPASAVFRLWVLSDLHVHRREVALPEPLPEFEALLVAGGIKPGLAASVEWLGEALAGAQADRPVAFVPGALEFSDGVPVSEALGAADVIARRFGISLLHDGSVRLGPSAGDGLHIMGATLWPDLACHGPEKASQARAHARARWKAIRRVSVAPGIGFKPHDVAGAHARSRAFLEDALATVAVGGGGFGSKPDVAPIPDARPGDRAIVVSAFAPSRACLPRELSDPMLDPWAAAWQASSLDALFDRWSAPALWLFGGVPFAWDVRLGRTRLVANPAGDGDPTSGFDASRVVVV